jgi:hypothetical protein
MKIDHGGREVLGQIEIPYRRDVQFLRGFIQLSFSLPNNLITI